LLCPAKKRRSAPTGLQKARRLAAIAARIALAVIVLNWIGMPAFAQVNAEWQGTTSDWNTGANWTGNAVPDGMATFSGNGMKSLTFSSMSTSVGTLSFTAPGYSFEVKPLPAPFFSELLLITSNGIDTSSTANVPTFNILDELHFINSSTAGLASINVSGTGNVQFNFEDRSTMSSANAGSATIVAGVAGSTNDDDGGFVQFFGHSTAENATITANFASNIEFHDASTAGHATLIADGPETFIFFNDTSTADHATITVNTGGELDFSANFGPPCCTGGTSTAGNATITNNGVTGFYQGSSAGNATITTNAGGVTSFFGRSTGGNAAFITNAGGIVDISGLGTFPDSAAARTFPDSAAAGTPEPPDPSVLGMTAGSIAGAGTYFLGSKQLTVGSNNSSTTVSGVIEDGGAAGGTGGSLVKVGTGTLMLTGVNTYSGGTTISQGTIAVIADTGLGAPTGSLTFNGGTLQFDSSFNLSPSRAITLNAANNGFAGGGTFDTNGFTTTISQVIQGAGGLTEAGGGVLVLSGDNTYAGGTTISAGTLQVGNGGATGSLGSGPVLDNSALAFNRSGTVTVPGAITGTGSLTQESPAGGTLVLTGENTYTGGTTIISGILELGSGGTTGSIVGNVTNNATLEFDHSNTFTVAGVISGSGGVAQIGTGTTILTANSTYSGLTTISGGTLAAGGVNVFSANSHTIVQSGGTLALQGFNQTLNNGLENAGTVQLGVPGVTPPGTTLTVAGNYVGNGGTLGLNTFLGGDGSPSDKLIINGGTADPSIMRITNVGGPGAETTANGILVVQAVNSATTTSNAFALPQGEELRAGDFDYDLFRGGLNGTDPQNWFLRSTFDVPSTPPPPPPPLPEIPASPLPTDPPPQPLPPGVWPIIGPELATDGVVQPIARQMGFTMLGTLHERIGDTLTTENAGPDAEGWGQSGWVRFFGQQIDNNYKAFADPSANGRIFGVQAGFDIMRASFIPGHRDVAGVYFAYGNSATDVTGLVTNPAATAYVFTRTGTVNLYGYSGGAYWTHYGPSGWYADAVLQGTVYNGTATTQFANLPTDGSGIITSLEVGYPIPLSLGPRFILEPQGQILWQHTSFRQAYDGLGEVGLGSTSGATGRLGLRAQSTIVTQNGQVWQPYVRANLWQNWGGAATTTFGVDQVPLLQQSTQLEFAAGLTFKYNPLLSFYTQAGYEFAVGGDTDGGKRQGVKGDIGVRLTFGAPPPPPPALVPAAAPAPAAARSYLVFFDWDKATLTGRARQIIREAAESSTRVAYTRIEVNGYTDTSGTPKYNQGLSVRRAQAVAGELVRDGVPASAISIRGFGETHLLVPTGPGVREPQNRRVEIVML
jgi:outer membrane autotransporter protein